MHRAAQDRRHVLKDLRAARSAVHHPIQMMHATLARPLRCQVRENLAAAAARADLPESRNFA